MEDRRIKRWKKVTLAVTALVLVGLAVLVVPTVWGKPWSINHFYARIFLQYMLDHPQLASSMRILEPLGLDFHNDELNDYSVAGTLRDMQRAADNLRMLHRYDLAGIDDTLSYEVLEWFVEIVVDGSEWAFHNYPVNQYMGFQSSLPNFMINGHHIGDVDDARDYLERLAEFGVAFDQMIESLRYREQRGIVPPRFVIVHVLEEMQRFVAPAPGDHVLVRHLDEALDGLESVEASDRTELVAEAARLVEQVVYSAYDRMIGHYRALEPRASTDDGFWKLPDGDACYAHRLRAHTTTDMTPEEVHQIGLHEVARVKSEMQAILSGQGLPSEDFGAALAAIRDDPRFSYPNTDEAREQILADCRAIIAEIEAGLDTILVTPPAAAVVVDRVPEFMQATAPAAYYDPPPMDGSRPGTFFVNLRDPAETLRHGMRTLTYHETIPGHHLQHAVARELEGVPFFRRVIPFTAYGEGWALYAEQLAAELGYQSDSLDRLGYLTAQMFRAVRVVVDTGIHHQRWTREQAIEYMLANTGMPETEVVSEVERYIVDPGQACAYMVGYLEIMRLRDEARQALGDDFDLREFNQLVLGQGALPLGLLRRIVEEWYTRPQGQARIIHQASKRTSLAVVRCGVCAAGAREAYSSVRYCAPAALVTPRHQRVADGLALEPSATLRCCRRVE